jgi:uncharacterized protein YlxW (UPF0749 family)
MKRTLAERLDAIERRVEELVAERDNLTAQAGEWQRAANEAENKLTRALDLLARFLGTGITRAEVKTFLRKAGRQ